ncbi:MAG TPA: MFS transporter [Bacteroidia bacterium]|nr:MFS transporter [Bacteroidia bacterium]
MAKVKPYKGKVALLVTVAALGYFVDIYDLLLFGIVRRESLQGIGVSADLIGEYGTSLLNWQMWGMLAGGIFWGILGDKRGRLSVLFGSIILYSLANLANGTLNIWAENYGTASAVNMYSLLRFIAGFGLAGELGAGITLVAEAMGKEHRGWGTTIVATVGVFGAVVAALVGQQVEWNVSYYIGGTMGLLLLILRIGVYESGMYMGARETKVQRGNFLQLFTSWKLFAKYFSVIFIAVPVWYVMSLYIVLSPEMALAMGMPEGELPVAGKSIMFAYIGITIGDVASGLLSQLLRSRKKALLVFMLLTIVALGLYYTVGNNSLTAFYTIATVIGFATGYWAVFITTAAESFGTNIRATVTTTAPNFVRGAVPGITFLFAWFQTFFVDDASVSGDQTRISAALCVGVIVMILAFISWRNLRETFGKDLDYVEGEENQLP